MITFLLLLFLTLLAVIFIILALAGVTIGFWWLIAIIADIVICVALLKCIFGKSKKKKEDK